MLVRLLALSMLLCTMMAPWIFAESTDCTAPVIIIPDGRLTQSSFPQNTSYWYAINAQARHSYSVEFEPPADNYLNTVRPRFAPLSIFAPTDFLQSCHGSSSVVVTQNSGYAPAILANSNGAGRRISFTAQTSGLYLIQVTNLMGTGAYTFRSVDTTCIGIRWNTAAGYDLLWTMLNVSDMTITGTFTALDMNGQVVAAMQFSIPPGGRVARSSATNDLNLPRNSVGSAMFSHNGPPNSIMAEAFLNGPTTATPEKFEALTTH